MKNIHLLQTDKPSRLYEDVDGDLQLGYDFIVRQGMLQNQHIYITNDEKPKEGDWRLDETFKPVNLWFYPEKLKGKIILTTDQDLIKDGVQAIDDEFLEWFVNNPSCEGVDTIIEYKDGYGFWFKYDKEFWDKMGNKPKFGTRYKIIIPKEETLEKEWKKHPKWGVRLNKDKLPDFTYVDSWYEGVLYKRNMLQLVYPNSPSFGGLKWKVFETKELAEKWIKNPIIPKEEPKCTCKRPGDWDCVYCVVAEPKKETLEEAAEKSFNDSEYLIDKPKYTLGFIEGAKYQAERMYSEEYMLKFAEFCRSYDIDCTFKNIVDVKCTIELFEQFKKK